jgi:hypothetical protein
VVYRVKKSKVLMEDTWEKDLDLRLSKRSLEFEEQVISMLEFLIDNIFVSFGGILFQQVVGIPMGTNCAPLLVDLFLSDKLVNFLTLADMELKRSSLSPH